MILMTKNIYYYAHISDEDVSNDFNKNINGNKNSNASMQSRLLGSILCIPNKSIVV